MNPEQNPLHKKIYFGLVAAIIVTTLLARYNLNSQCIIVLLLCMLSERKLRDKLIRAGSNPFGIACFLLFAMTCIGLLYSKNFKEGWNLVEKKATLVAIPFILNAGPFRNEEDRKKIMTAFCLLLFAVSAYCLVFNLVLFLKTGDHSVFFYHALVSPVLQNAIFFSVFTGLAVLFLLASNLEGIPVSMGTKRKLRAFLIIYFIGFMVLLASKLMLILLLAILAAFFIKRKSLQKKILLGGILTLGIALIILFTNNPIKARYLDIVREPLIKEGQISPATYFNGVQLRLLEWKFAAEIVSENKAWLLGVGPGDSQDKLNEKYILSHMWVGNAAGSDSGFLGYNFHNEYIEQWVKSGLLGLVILLFAFYSLFRICIRLGTRESIFTAIIISVVFFVESPLLMQDGLFFFSFFPCLLQYGLPKNGHALPDQ